MTLSVHIQTKRYPNGKCAIQDLRFAAGSGKFVAIVGPSGSGKTTLLKIISGLDKDYQGSLQLPPLSRLGFMFQEPRLMPWLTVAQNLLLVAPNTSATELAQALERVGLRDCAALFPKQLSGGMQRRVALLRAFLIEPQLLLMDEPFQSLDLPTADQLRAQLQSLWQIKKPTVLFVTHNLAEALSLADRVLFLTGSPSSVALDFAVGTPHPRGLDSSAVQALAKQLLHAHPDLLKGSLGLTA